MSHRQAFTLIELLVVMAILGIILGIAFAATGRQQRQSQVRAAAEELAAVLSRTRHQAMSRGVALGVAFNIENAPGSSGKVLNNRSGGHWYRVIGPSTHLFSSASIPDAIPWASSTYEHFPRFIAEVQRSWMGDAVVLPPGKVRFLALSDTDEGPRARGADPGAWVTQPYGATYPRPWFGYYDPAAQRLYPWGGYDQAIAKSGFRYEGKDGAIAGCRNPTDRRYDVPFAQGGKDYYNYQLANSDLNQDGDMDDYGETELGFPVWRKDEPRPLVNAAWLDAVIIFLPNGTVRFGEWNRGRRMYHAAQARNHRGSHNGVADRAKPCHTDHPLPSDDRRLPAYTGLDYEYQDDIPEVAHFDRHTGGWYITLAPDARDDRDHFPDERSALAGLTPMWRVYVGRNGVARALAVANPIGWLDGQTTWPGNPNVWAGPATTASDPLWRDCRLGWLHEPNTKDAGTGSPLKPRGRPITDVVCAPMLSQRVWWLDE